MTDEEIERKVKRFIDHMDRVLAAGFMTQKTYDKGIQEIAQWAEAKRQSAAQ
jgi:hypothetical protein